MCIRDRDCADNDGWCEHGEVPVRCDPKEDLALALEAYAAQRVAEAVERERRRYRCGFDIGSGKFREGDFCTVGGNPGVLTAVFHDGAAEVRFFDLTCGMFKWKQIEPYVQEPPRCPS